ncbi:hypothetical protein [Oceanobacillus kimchii]|uniref:Uncharacterized protein n=1 Tax=Oceanobacillus kimchii TaxID=746691 RepID=A0ABQ5TH52_9BACI|nr:hypothetical protein [Oceanobacillus kimchii]GLO66203.1 hypothetical protein MACH08_19870 [Oceanobacillus kimchii]
MSSSSLWLMDKEFNGVVDSEYRNSWWFSPVVWDVLLDKYMHNEIQTPYGYKKSIIGMGGAELSNQLNEIINGCTNFSDRICWEMSQQQVFYTKDKKEVAQAILDFSDKNTQYHIDKEENVSVLVFDHIKERFQEIAKNILDIDEEKYPYFIFKNTSVDDNVERWFEKYDDEEDEYGLIPLSEFDEYVTEFVVIENGNINRFISNLDFFK